ncbi:hypothetical protein BOW10_10910 [Solemya velum gill symbiont]|nr:hypothetical protein BOW10_10910 [Solemya velum gill symbiont]
MVFSSMLGVEASSAAAFAAASSAATFAAASSAAAFAAALYLWQAQNLVHSENKHLAEPDSQRE